MTNVLILVYVHSSPLCCTQFADENEAVLRSEQAAELAAADAQKEKL